MKVPAVGVFDFPRPILGGEGKYVGKTELLYRLANDVGQQLFISRPRRFGKSLMPSTRKAMFERWRELFKGLALDSLLWEEWEQLSPRVRLHDVEGCGRDVRALPRTAREVVKSLCADPAREFDKQPKVLQGRAPSRPHGDWRDARGKKKVVTPESLGAENRGCMETRDVVRYPQMERNEHTIRVPTTGVFDFPSLILEGEGKYVDKTELLYRLAAPRTDAQYFISRPRRFGKSLMLSTLKAMFEGRRELFKGLAIDSLPWEGWDSPHPVLHFDMSRLSPSEGRDAMKAALFGQICVLSEKFGVGPLDSDSIGFAFDELIAKVAAKSPDGKVVVLVDEYDAPMTSVLDDPEYFGWMRSFLHDFYCRLKSNSGVIRFLMITGVTKLTKLSIFSGLNHLTDLSMNARFATLLGYTPEELDGALRENIEVFAAKNGMDFAAAKRALLAWYDGYRFSPQSEARVCNPVSLGSALKSGELKNYWESTGQSTMIVNRIKAADEIPADLNGLAATGTQLDVCDAETMPLPALLYQGGYLTLSEVIDDTTFRLGIPNKEIANSLAEGYVSSLLGNGLSDWTEQLAESRAGLRAKGVETLLRKNLKAAFAAVPHEWKIENEKEAKRYFLLFMKLIGADISGERQRARGRADAVLQDKGGTYVFEFKYGRTPGEALEQAKTKAYGNPWLDSTLPVFHVGVNYDPEKRGIDDPLVEALKR